jgi:AcrR family transcriptional regulator
MYSVRYPLGMAKASQPHPRRTGRPRTTSSGGRTRRPRGSLSREVILDAAEAIASQGFDSLTMRAVAARLGAVPMALYNHFATKEELVNALLDRVLGRFEPAPPTGDRAEDLRRFARAHRRVLTTHPWAVAPIFSHPDPGPNAFRIGEHALGILRRGGLSEDDAVAAFSGILALNYGWSSFTAARDLDPTGAVAEQMGEYGGDRHYELVLDRLVR